jgi:hypothetical protein
MPLAALCFNADFISLLEDGQSFSQFFITSFGATSLDYENSHNDLSVSGEILTVLKNSDAHSNEINASKTQSTARILSSSALGLQRT